MPVKGYDDEGEPLSNPRMARYIDASVDRTTKKLKSEFEEHHKGLIERFATKHWVLLTIAGFGGAVGGLFLAVAAWTVSTSRSTSDSSAEAKVEPLRQRVGMLAGEFKELKVETKQSGREVQLDLRAMYQAQRSGRRDERMESPPTIVATPVKAPLGPVKPQ